jgi:hypothetical protein
MSNYSKCVLKCGEGSEGGVGQAYERKGGNERGKASE